jgi:PPK2 family polyphosphate:nucleotide phosphotransferase
MKHGDMFQTKPGSKVDLSRIDTDFCAGFKDEDSARDKTKKNFDRLRDLQYSLYAEGKRSLLICLQGLDASGKDGTITHVLGSMDPLGTRVYAFKVPTLEEAAHDFLWRVEKQAPAKGEVVIFNRSHYEDVLVARVHKLVPEGVWSKRYGFINSFEENLAANGTHILKFYLHISPEEQLKRFKERLEDPSHQWKISESDYIEREYWKDYVRAYEDVFRKTSSKDAPWYIIPADHKWFRNFAISSIVVEKLESMDIKIPEPTVDLDEIRHKYHQAEKRETKLK